MLFDDDNDTSMNQGIDTKSDLDQLISAWKNESCSPTLFRFQTELVSTFISVIEDQTDILEKSYSSADVAFISLLYQQEIERIKYIIRNYMRTRLKKIDIYYNFFLSDQIMKSRLSPQELRYAQKLKVLCDQFNVRQISSQYPEHYTSKEQDHIIEPNLRNAVYIKMMQDVGDYVMDGE